MSRRFLMKEIALQAGVGLATVDRVLNGRPNVHERSRQRVQHAIKELERQQFQLAVTGRKLVVDVLVEAPSRFCDEIREAFESELPTLRPAVFRPRFTMQDTMTTAQVVDALEAMDRRGTHGVLLKARDVPEVTDAIAALRQRGIPVVTIFTDIPRSARIAYAGLDNRMAGATAAFLIGQWLAHSQGNVLVAMSDDSFRGEEERKDSFRDELHRRYPKLTLVDASGGHGLDAQTEERVRKAIGRKKAIAAVYSMGGGTSRYCAPCMGWEKRHSASLRMISTGTTFGCCAMEALARFCITTCVWICATLATRSCISTNCCRRRPSAIHRPWSW